MPSVQARAGSSAEASTSLACRASQSEPCGTRAYLRRDDYTLHACIRKQLVLQLDTPVSSDPLHIGLVPS